MQEAWNQGKDATEARKLVTESDENLRSLGRGATITLPSVSPP